MLTVLYILQYKCTTYVTQVQSNIVRWPDGTEMSQLSWYLTWQDCETIHETSSSGRSR